MRRALLTGLLWLCGAVCARADDVVILLEQGSLRPGLCAALRIQLADAAKVRCEAEPADTVLNERIAHAAERVKEEDARVGLLLERDPDPRLVRMYIVAARSDQAVVAIERIEDRPEPDVDRSLALKVRDAFFVIEQVTERPKTPLAAVVAPVPPAPPPAPGALSTPAVAKGPQVGPGYEVWLDVGGGLSLVPGARGLFSGALGFSRVSGHVRFELGAGARFLAQHLEVKDGASVSEVERGPLLSLRLLREGARFALGGALEPTLWLSHARGTTRDGEQGSDRKTLLALALALDVRVRLVASVALRFALALEWLTTQQRYAVDGQVVSDLGRVHVLLPLSLFVGLPVGGGAP